VDSWPDPWLDIPNVWHTALFSQKPSGSRCFLLSGGPKPSKAVAHLTKRTACFKTDRANAEGQYPSWDIMGPPMAMALALDIGQAPQFVILSRLAAADFWMVCRMQPQHLSFVAWQAPLYWGVKGSLGDFKNYTRMIENDRPEGTKGGEGFDDIFARSKSSI